MTYNSVEHMLKNRRNIGEFRYRDTVVPDGIPVIVPQDMFDRVQEKLEQNKKAPAQLPIADFSKKYTDDAHARLVNPV